MLPNVPAPKRLALPYLSAILLNAARHMAAPLARDPHREFFQQVQDDRKIMRRQVPRHVDVLLEEA